MKMDKQEVIYLMLDSITETNNRLGQQYGMAQEEIDKQVEMSLPSMVIIVSDIYDKMKEANLLA
jgi:hypothetical protein